MGFQFALSPVLWMREVIEEREELLLRQIAQEIAETAESIDSLDAELADADADRHNQLAKSCSGAHLHACYGHMQDLRIRRTELEQKKRKLEELRGRQMQAYQAAHRDRQMLDEMRGQERATYDSLMARREQSRLDDRFGAQRARRNSLP